MLTTWMTLLAAVFILKAGSHFSFIPVVFSQAANVSPTDASLDLPLSQADTLADVKFVVFSD